MSIKGSANGRGGEWWEGNKNIDSDAKYKRVISVWACYSDTIHPKLLELATQAGVFSQERYQQILDTDKPELTCDELGIVLESYFGFEGGNYEEHIIEGIQRTRFNDVGVGEVRYTGVERTDKSWCSTGLASQEAKELCKYGGVLSVE